MFFSEYRSDQVAELASDNDAGGEDAQAPDDGEVSGTVFGCQDLRVDEAEEEVLFGCGGASARGGGEETLLRRAVEPWRGQVECDVRMLVVSLVMFRSKDSSSRMQVVEYAGA